MKRKCVLPYSLRGAVGEGLMSSRVLLWGALAVGSPAEHGREGPQDEVWGSQYS